MSGRICRPTTCNIFFQEKEAMNIESFYALRRLEWQASREHEAATKIQTFFRKWLTAKNMKLLNEAAIKCQTIIRGFIARRRVQALRAELERKAQEALKNQSATAIQSMWKGFYSRKNCMDYRKYKNLQGKNDEYTQCIETMNELESIVTSDTTSSLSCGDTEEILKRLMEFTSITDILKLSPSRVCALQERIHSIHEECIRKGGRPTEKSLELEDALRCGCSGTRPRRIRSDADLFQFVDLTGIKGIVEPDLEKVIQLREAIRKHKCNLKMLAEDQLAKKHYLLRTSQTPGVLSDICSSELTPEEKKLKELKFWKAPTVFQFPTRLLMKDYPRRGPSKKSNRNTIC